MFLVFYLHFVAVETFVVVRVEFFAKIARAFVLNTTKTYLFECSNVNAQDE